MRYSDNFCLREYFLIPEYFMDNSGMSGYLLTNSSTLSHKYRRENITNHIRKNRNKI